MIYSKIISNTEIRFSIVIFLVLPPPPVLLLFRLPLLLLVVLLVLLLLQLMLVGFVRGPFQDDNSVLVVFAL
jgi:hypothetical protein